MATILVRALDQNGDPQRGQGLANFLEDGDAVAQIIATTIKLLQGEWFLNVNDGTPLFQKLLGHATTTQAVALILRSRILSVPFVTGISSLSVVYVQGARRFVFSASVTTQFGQVSISNH
jgi:hypothetical protein